MEQWHSTAAALPGFTVTLSVTPVALVMSGANIGSFAPSALAVAPVAPATCSRTRLALIASPGGAPEGSAAYHWSGTVEPRPTRCTSDPPGATVTAAWPFQTTFTGSTRRFSK